MPSTLNRTGYLTLRQAAAWLGMGTDRNSARRLLRLLKAKERQYQVKLLHRTEGGHIRVTKAQLKRYCREQWNRRDEVIGIVKERLAGFNEVASRIKIVQRSVGARVAANSRAIERLNRAVFGQVTGP